MTNDEIDEVIGVLFQSLLSRYQIWLKASIQGSTVMFGYVYVFQYKSHTLNFKLGWSDLSSIKILIDKK